MVGEQDERRVECLNALRRRGIGRQPGPQPGSDRGVRGFRVGRQRVDHRGVDAIGSADRADSYLRERVLAGERIMGFGHAVYRTEDPRSRLLKGIAQSLGGDLVDLAVAVERQVVDVLADLKPGRDLYANVEYYAGVVMHLCGVPREMFTPTFAASRVVGWCANMLEQAADSKIIRPAARYVGPPPPQPVPF